MILLLVPTTKQKGGRERARGDGGEEGGNEGKGAQKSARVGPIAPKVSQAIRHTSMSALIRVLMGPAPFQKGMGLINVLGK